MMNVADLSAKLGLDTSVFDRGITGVLGRMNPIGGAALGASAIAVGAVGAIGYAAFKMGAEFDTAYDSIRIGTGATGAKLDGLKNDFKKVVTDVPASFGDASAAITGLNQRLGATGPRLRDLSDQFLELSRITGTDVAEDVRLGTRLFGDWSIKTEGQAGALDQLFRATQQSGIGLSDLMATVVQFGAPLRNMGFSFSDSIAMLSKWEKEGVNITTVLSGMRFALKSFSKEGIDPAKGFAKAIDDITKAKTRAAAMKIGSDIFGLRGASDTVAAIREGRFQYQKFADTIANGRDTIHTAAKDTEDLGESWTKMVNALKVKAEPAASGLFGFIGNLASDMNRNDVIATVAGIKAASDKLAAGLPKQWGVAAQRTKDIIEDLGKLAEKPRILGPLNAKHTQGQLKNIRDDIVKQLGITVEEANQIMDRMFKGWTPKSSLVAPIKESAAQVEARIQKMRDKLARNLRHGHLDNGPLIAKIAAAEARYAQMRAKLAQSIAVGSLNTSGWTGPITSAMSDLQNFRTLAGAGLYVPPVIIDVIRRNAGKGGALGGTFTGPKSGYYTLMHGKETIVAHDDPALGLKELAKYGLLGGGAASSGASPASSGRGGTNIAVNVNAPVYGVDDLHSIVYAGTMAAMEEAQVAEGRSARGSVR